MTEATRRVPWEARNPEYEAAVRESFARQSHMATLGARITRLEAGAVFGIQGDASTLIATMLSTIIIRPLSPQ